MMSKEKYWIWFWGDFSIHQGMLQNFSREERGMRWPAYWYVDDCYKNVKFERHYDLTAPTTFTVHSHQNGYLTIDEQKYQLNHKISLAAGKHDIVIYVYSANELPTVFIDGDVIYSDQQWVADNYFEKRPVGTSKLFASLNCDPNNVQYAHQAVAPKSIKVINGGTLVDFGQELNASLHFNKLDHPVTVCYGESSTEALDVDQCYYKQENISETTSIPKRAFRYIYLPELEDRNLEVEAVSIYLPATNRSAFTSNDQTLNQIWQVSTRTFRLCSDLFFIDVIKRDRWIWGGDAFQDNYINQYSYFNADIDKRTIVALRGHDEVHQQINTIVDYSLLWIISVYNHYQMTADKDFVAKIMPRMEKMMDYLLATTDDHGFLVGKKDDWIFIDWAEIDKDGAVAGEQMFLLQALKAMTTCKQLLGQDASHYEKLTTQLKKNVVKFFWDEKQNAFIDSFQSGKHHVSRHANILAIFFDLVDQKKKQQILNHVLLNKDVPEITTPYFKFFEQDALCQMGQYDQVLSEVKDYWGSMINRGATTVWEEFNPNVTGADQYAMYGDVYGKSLCHAWGASPIYLLGRYFMGVHPTAPGCQTFLVEPHLAGFKELKSTVPVNNGSVTFELADNQLRIQSTRPGGTVRFNGHDYQLDKNIPVILSLDAKKE